MVSVGLMVILIGVLSFVFQESSMAVGGATEAVNVWQKARNFNARLGRELASAMEFAVHRKSGAKTWFERPFALGEGEKPQEADSGNAIEFVSRTLNDGVLGSWDVKYVYEEEAGTDYGSIVRKKDRPDVQSNEFDLWDHAWDDRKDEVIAYPVRPIAEGVPIFSAGGNWAPLADKVPNTKIPPTVRTRLVFLDSLGGRTIRIPVEFYFPIYQGQ